MRQGTAEKLEHPPSWETRIPELVDLLAAAAPELRSLEITCPSESRHSRWAGGRYSAAGLPEELGRLTQLTRLGLGFGLCRVTSAQVNFV